MKKRKPKNKNQRYITIFQVGNLTYASPATVSRAGMVYVDPKNLRYSPYWQRWLKTRTEFEQKRLNVILIKIYVYK